MFDSSPSASKSSNENQQWALPQAAPPASSPVKKATLRHRLKAQVTMPYRSQVHFSGRCLTGPFCGLSIPYRFILGSIYALHVIFWRGLSMPYRSVLGDYICLTDPSSVFLCLTGQFFGFVWLSGHFWGIYAFRVNFLSGIRLAPSALEEAKKKRNNTPKKPANKNWPGVKGPAWGCQQWPSKKPSLTLFQGSPCKKKATIFFVCLFVCWSKGHKRGDRNENEVQLRLRYHPRALGILLHFFCGRCVLRLAQIQLKTGRCVTVTSMAAGSAAVRLSTNRSADVSQISSTLTPVM